MKIKTVSDIKDGLIRNPGQPIELEQIKGPGIALYWHTVRRGEGGLMDYSLFTAITCHSLSDFQLEMHLNGLDFYRSERFDAYLPARATLPAMLAEAKEVIVAHLQGRVDYYSNLIEKVKGLEIEVTEAVTE